MGIGSCWLEMVERIDESVLQCFGHTKRMGMIKGHLLEIVWVVV